ncbi:MULTISPECIES: TauD/TfdA family dioxygenase [Streptomyces]|uniref:TauD/TfdA family dioxygenase n=1 Tax=Streptomyces TaxID=1883 RepID=UPI000CD52700|nr:MULTISPECIES: TauD/TfdA family dioxygenase [Streptomyces]MCX4713019.1 TauD/TfdA family dioxygenase [Streptomyces griseus]QXR00643.1 TauD/TfdA family dioxygenase [Streptomyces sp. WY228]
MPYSDVDRFAGESTAVSEDAVPVVEAEAAAGDGLGWLRTHAAALRSVAVERGAVLVRGLGLREPADAAAASRALTSELMTELEGFAPRTALPGGVYSSSQWPPDQPMCMHHELSNAARYPRWLVLSCLEQGSSGGAVSVADARAVLAGLPADVAASFERDGWQLVRNYSPLLGVALADAFGTDDRAAVSAYCAAHGIAHEWTEAGGLRTRQTLPAVVEHPQTGERCWFNQIAFLNEWTMDPAVRELLLAEFGADGLPFTTFRGDGTALDRATVDTINEVYDRHAVAVPWRKGDLLLIDNIAAAHSRAPYRGERRVVVALGDPLARVRP